MHSLSKLSLGALLVCLGGCIVTWGYNDYDVDGNGGSPATGGSGGMSSMTTGGAGGGTGGVGGIVDPCSTPICDAQSVDCPGKQCLVTDWARRFGNALPQEARAVAIGSDGKVFIGGTYDETLTIGNTINGDVKDAFVAMLKADGTPMWVVTGNEMAAGTAPRAINALTLDGDNHVFVTGYTSDTSGVHRAFALRIVPSDDPLMPQPTLDVFSRLDSSAGTIAQTEGIAASAIGSDVYVVGRVVSQGNVDCLDPDVPGMSKAFNLPVGAYVAKYNATNACQWITSIPSASVTPTAITAKIGGISIAGHFSGTLPLTGEVELKTTSQADAFVVRLDPSTGVVTGGFQVGQYDTAKVRAYAIDSDDSGSVLLGGQLQGATALDGGAKTFANPVGFLARFDTIGIPKAYRIFGVGELPTMFDENRVTGIAYRSTGLHVVGMFVGTMVVDRDTNVSVTRDSNNPFLAVVDGTTLQLKGFHSFDGGGESFAFERSLPIAANNAGIAIATGWLQSINLFTPGTSNGDTTPIDKPAPQHRDIVVAKFGLNSVNP